MGAVLGLVGVAAGAFGAHGLRDSVSARDLATWQTGAHYEQVHAILLVAIGLLGRADRSLRAAALLLTAGIVVFSGTLYAIVLGGPRTLGAVTPLGGLCLIGGWAALVVAGIRARRAGTSSSSGPG